MLSSEVFGVYDYFEVFFYAKGFYLQLLCGHKAVGKQSKVVFLVQEVKGFFFLFRQ